MPNALLRLILAHTLSLFVAHRNERIGAAVITRLGHDHVHIALVIVSLVPMGSPRYEGVGLQGLEWWAWGLGYTTADTSLDAACGSVQRTVCDRISDINWQAAVSPCKLAERLRTRSVVATLCAPHPRQSGPSFSFECPCPWRTSPTWSVAYPLVPDIKHKRPDSRLSLVCQLSTQPASSSESLRHAFSIGAVRGKSRHEYAFGAWKPRRSWREVDDSSVVSWGGR